MSTVGGKPHFFVSLGIVEILGFSELSIYTEVVLLRVFHFNYVSLANIEEVMKFYSLGNKSFKQTLIFSFLQKNLFCSK